MNRINLRIGGMTCQSCVGVIEKGLEKVKGVHSSTVNLLSPAFVT